MTSPEPRTDPSAPNRMITPEQRMDALREVNRGRSPLAFVWEWMKIFPMAVFLFVVIHTFLVEAFKIPSGSMEHTLLVGDFLLVNKALYGAEVPFTSRHLPRLAPPKRGDVVVFKWPQNPQMYLVKRVAGVPGDTLSMQDGTLMRNGSRVPEGYVEHTDPDVDPSFVDFRWQRDFVVPAANAAIGYHPSRNNWGPLVVPQQNYFVLGDNRDISLDSRYWGFVPDSMIKGRPILIYYSFAPDSADHFAWLTRVRWTRLGERVH